MNNQNSLFCLLQDLIHLNDLLHKMELKVQDIKSAACILSNRDRISHRLKHLEKTSQNIRFEIYRICGTGSKDHLSDDFDKAIKSNRELIRHLNEGLDNFDEILYERKLNLIKVIPEEDLSSILPEFNGYKLPLFHHFMEDFEEKCDLSGLPNVLRRRYLLDSIKGTAKQTIEILGFDKEPTYEVLVDFLRTYFGDFTRETNALLTYQRSLDPIPSLGQRDVSKEQAHLVCRKHVQVFQELEFLVKLFDEGRLDENPIHEAMLRNLEQAFPRELLLGPDFDLARSRSERFQSLFHLAEKLKSLFLREIVRGSCSYGERQRNITHPLCFSRKRKLRRRRKKVNSPSTSCKAIVGHNKAISSGGKKVSKMRPTTLSHSLPREQNVKGNYRANQVFLQQTVQDVPEKYSISCQTFLTREEAPNYLDRPPDPCSHYDASKHLLALCMLLSLKVNENAPWFLDNTKQGLSNY